jgi:hypothetical protein
MGSPGDLIDRTAQNTYTNSEFGAWAALDLGVGFPLNPTRYSLRNRSDGPGNIIRSWNLQGSTDVGEWSVAGINAATWTDLDRRTNDASLTFSDQWGHWDVTAQPNAYRYIRIIMTGPESSGNWYLTIDEIELYGVVTLAPNLPSGATGWLTDGTHYVPYY